MVKNIQRHWALLRALWSERAELTTPFFITLDVTPRCNLTCIGCRYHSQILSGHHRPDKSAGDMPIALIERLARELSFSRPAHLFVEGSGEPFLHPHILEMLTLLKKAGLKITVFTNGTQLDKEKIETLIRIQVDVIRISLFAASEAVFKRNYCGTDVNCFHRIIENMRQFSRLRREKHAKKPLLQLYFGINRLNKEELPSVVELAGQTGCDAVTFGRFVEFGQEVDGLALNHAERQAMAEQLKNLRHDLNSMGIGNTLDRDVLMHTSGPETWRAAPCLIGWFHLRIRGNGDVVPCCRCNYLYGNLNEQSFGVIWNGDRMAEFRLRSSGKDGAQWLKELGSLCHDCPHAAEMIKLYRAVRGIKAVKNILRRDPLHIV